MANRKLENSKALADPKPRRAPRGKRCCALVPYPGEAKKANPATKQCHFSAVNGPFCGIHSKIMKAACSAVAQEAARQATEYPTLIWDLLKAGKPLK